jgi:predicted MFS family arabinose efflux permease
VTAPGWAPALALALAAAVSLGLARFAYGLLLPAMRADLGWSYLLAGAMNTANAAGYLIGALLLPRALARHDARRLLLFGGWASAALLAAHALTRSDALLLALRLATGAASAASFVCGGLLAARLASQGAPGGADAGPHAKTGAGPRSAGLVLGLYYGGVGVGIVASTLLLPLGAGAAGGGPFGWPAAWVALGALAALFTALTARGTRRLHAPPSASAPRERAAWAPMRWTLAGYLCFGLGYIGYMTFAVTLLREQGQTAGQVMAFYSLLGLGVMASSWLWAGLLQRHRDGRPLARLNALLALATALPVLGTQPPLVLASGALFGAVFLSVVASTTAFVRHNLPPAAWASGISAYTVLFAAGQIVGPGAVGWVADQAGGGALGLTRGLAVSAAVLALGALLASRQRALG